MAAAFSLGGSLLAEAEDVLEAVLQEVDAAALLQLKAASVAWRTHVRRELCNRLWVRLSAPRTLFLPQPLLVLPATRKTPRKRTCAVCGYAAYAFARLTSQTSHQDRP